MYYKIIGKTCFNLQGASHFNPKLIQGASQFCIIFMYWKILNYVKVMENMQKIVQQSKNT